PRYLYSFPTRRSSDLEILLPFFSFVLVVYLILSWRSASAVYRQAEKSIETQGNLKLAKIMAFAILAPVLLGLLINYLLQQRDIRSEEHTSELQSRENL